MYNVVVVVSVVWPSPDDSPSSVDGDSDDPGWLSVVWVIEDVVVVVLISHVLFIQTWPEGHPQSLQQLS